MILIIETADQKKVKIALKEAGKEIASLEEENKYGSQVTLSLITKLVKIAGLNLKDLRGIKVNSGPGSFTGIRVGVSIANALGFTLGIPVNGKEIETALSYT